MEYINRSDVTNTSADVNFTSRYSVRVNQNFKFKLADRTADT